MGGSQQAGSPPPPPAEVLSAYPRFGPSEIIGIGGLIGGRVRVRKGGQNTQVPQPMAPTVGIRGLIGKVPPSGGTSPTVPSLLVTIPLHLTPSRSPCFCVEAERPSGHTKPSAAAAEREGGGPWWDSGEGCPNKKKIHKAAGLCHQNAGVSNTRMTRVHH